MDNQTIIANAALQIKYLFLDISDRPVKAQGTIDGVQYSVEVETVKANTDVELLLWKSEDNYPGRSGKLAYLYYNVSFELKAGTATADLKWKLQARDKDGTWTDMCAEQTETTIGTDYVACRIEGFLDIQSGVNKLPLEIRLIIQSNESKSSVQGTDIEFVDANGGNDSITRVAADFLTAGFVVGDIITVTGSNSNNADYTILAVIAGTIEVATGSLTAEGAGADVTIASTGQGIGQVKNNTVINPVGRVV